jgi:hypothetical protein
VREYQKGKSRRWQEQEREYDSEIMREKENRGTQTFNLAKLVGGFSCGDLASALCPLKIIVFESKISL